LRDYTDSGVIFAVVLLNAVVGFTQEYKAEESIRSLQKMLALNATVVRDGSEVVVNAKSLVPGDIVLLQSGQKVPADIRLLKTKELQVDESAFTGESALVEKSPNVVPLPEAAVFEQINMAFMGSSVTSGRARGVIVATGQDTELGAIAENVQTMEITKTPLETRMRQLTKYIVAVLLLFSAVGFLIGAAMGEHLEQLFLTVMAMIVASIPEGLPVALTVALAVAVNRMAKHRAIIRYLPAIETLGSSTVIGSDKTGTLTMNEMTVQRMWTDRGFLTVQGSGYEAGGSVRDEHGAVDLSNRDDVGLLLKIGLLANESHVVIEDGLWKAQGDPTEAALIVSARRGGLDHERVVYDYGRLDIVPFESEYRFMATLNEHDEARFIFAKGAPEAILPRCSDLPGSAASAAELLSKARKMSSSGLRVLAFAYRKVRVDTEELRHEDVRDLTFVGFQGMMDPPRPEAIEAVAAAKRGGIRTLMITGDNADTALAIASTMRIANSADTALTGADIDRLSEEELSESVTVTSVFARVSPLHKLRIVNALKRNGEIVTVTGDGVNDAPALKAAHVGAAMGRSGTDVAKEASDMVITDDNFASVYRAVIEGRVAFDNIRKVTYFLLTTGAGLLIAIFTTTVTNIPLMLLPAQILWINLVTNGLQDVALAFDPKESGVETRSPRPVSEGVLNSTLLARLAVLALVMAAIALAVFVLSLGSGYSLVHARTLVMTTVVFLQFFHVFNSRSEYVSVFRHSVINNPFLFYSIIAALLAQLAAIYVPFMQYIFKTVPLSPIEFMFAVGAASVVLFASELVKLAQHKLKFV
jgi:Ca2+-transporting ATPase